MSRGGRQGISVRRSSIRPPSLAVRLSEMPEQSVGTAAVGRPTNAGVKCPPDGGRCLNYGDNNSLQAPSGTGCVVAAVGVVTHERKGVSIFSLDIPRPPSCGKQQQSKLNPDIPYKAFSDRYEAVGGFSHSAGPLWLEICEGTRRTPPSGEGFYPRMPGAAPEAATGGLRRGGRSGCIRHTWRFRRLGTYYLFCNPSTSRCGRY